MRPSAGLAHDTEDESRQGQHPSPAPGLLAQPMKPFETALAHPARSAPSPAGDEIEGSTYPHPDDGPGTGQVAGEPGLFRGGPARREQPLGAARRAAPRRAQAP